MKIIITGACAVSARNVLRSLKMSEIFKDAIFIGWDMCSILYGVYSKAFDKMYKVPAVTDPQYRSIVSDILEREKPDAVMVIPEVEVLYWAKNPFEVPHLVPPADFCELAISKRKLFNLLKGTELIPFSVDISRKDVFDEKIELPLTFPMWVRDASAGTASGKGSFMAQNLKELRAWVDINSGFDNFQLSEYCPGGNYGVLCLFQEGKLLKVAIAERLEYIMAKVAVSGITGNTSKGRFLNDDSIKKNALDAIERVCQASNTIMNGLVVVDMKADKNGIAKVTEINIRYVAYNCCLASAGFNLAEYHLLTALGRSEELSPEQEISFPQNNLFLRDVDALPIYIEDYKPLAIGESY
jgi:carbamoyl-phosphate synthase large subunit